MTLLEKFYEWWDRADFEEIIFTFITFTVFAILLALLATLFIGFAIGGAQ